MTKIILTAFFLSLTLLSVNAQQIDSTTSPTATGKTDSPVNAAAQNATQTTAGYVRPTATARFKRYLNNTIGPFALLGVGIASGFDQANNNPPEWKKTGAGFARRFGSNFSEGAIQETVTYGLDEALKLDSKFYRSQKRDFSSRFKNALLSSFTGRTPSGKRVFDPSRVVGSYAGSLVATNTWYPARFSSQDGFRRGSQAVAFSVGFNFLNEFLFKRK